MSHKKAILELLEKGVPYNEISRITGASKSTISYHANRQGVVPAGRNRSPLRHPCLSCLELIPKGKKFCSRDCERSYKVQEGIWTYPEKKDQVRSFYQKQKLRSIEYKGGACALCRYDRCPNALVFHHVDPAKKEFNISGGSRGWDKTRAELDKCVLLCHNCHSEVHAGYVVLVGPPSNDLGQEG